jgi:hypothetical protein
LQNLITKFLCLTVLVLSLSGCTNNPLAWKLLYGQFDNFLSKQLIGYAEFTESEKDLIRLEVDKTVLWHRQYELPKYAATITEFQNRFLAQQTVPSQTDMDWLIVELNTIGLRFDEKSPLLSLIPMLAQISDLQVEQIAQTIDEEFIDSHKEWQKEADQDPAELSEKSLRKFFKRLGLSTNEAQRTALTESLRRRQLSRDIKQEVWREWADQILDILNSRVQPGFAERFADHYFSRLDLIEIKQAEKWGHDQTLFKHMFLGLFTNLEAEQKSSMNQKLEKFKATALELNQSI